MDDLNNDGLSKIAMQQQNKNVIDAIEFRSKYGGLSQENSQVIDSVIGSSMQSRNNQFDSSPLHQIARQLEIENLIKAVQFKSRYGGLSQEHAQMLDSFISQYANEKTDTFRK